jgi:hypothetical protein
MLVTHGIPGRDHSGIHFQECPFLLDRFLDCFTLSRCSPPEGVLVPLDASVLMPSI